MDVVGVIVAAAMLAGAVLFLRKAEARRRKENERLLGQIKRLLLADYQARWRNDASKVDPC